MPWDVCASLRPWCRRDTHLHPWVPRTGRLSASDLGGKGWDSTYGHGLVNPVAALQASPPRNSGGELQITRTRVKKTGDTRAMIGWVTNVPAMTVVKGPNGFERKDDTLTKVHQAPRP